MGSAVLLWLLATPEEGDRPFVEILQSVGAIDGPSETGLGVPRWERVRIELRVENRLAVDVHDLELDVALVSPGDGAQVIPGWSFRTESTETVPARETAYLRITRELPARRTSPPADEIAYRVTIRSYRLRAPDLATSIELLGSPTKSDQRAALASYIPIEGGEEAQQRLGDELALSLASLPPAPAASDALRMLFAVFGLGALQDASHVSNLLYLPEVLDAATWGKAVIDLATRMVAASEADEPRLRVLPTWAREQSALMRVRSSDAIEDAVRDAILRVGDRAVPVLLEHSHTVPEPEVRVRAVRLLHALGRSTVRSQLALRDRSARLRVIAVLGEIGSAEPVPALVEIVKGPDRELSDAAGKALIAIGPSAIDPLVDALGSTNDTLVLPALEAIAVEHAAIVRLAADRYGILYEPSAGPKAMIDQLRQHLSMEHRARLIAEIEHALDLGRDGSYTMAFSRLDGVFVQDPELYMSFSGEIAELYFSRGRRLFARGDYEAAIETVRTGLSIHASDEGQDLLTEAQIQLAHGLVDLGELDRAQQIVESIQPGRVVARTRAVEGKVLAHRAKAAIDRGDYGQARTLVDRARSMNASDPELILASRRLLVSENLAIIIIVMLVVPVGGLVLLLSIRKRLDSAKMERLATAIDRGSRS